MTNPQLYNVDSRLAPRICHIPDKSAAGGVSQVAVHSQVLYRVFSTPQHDSSIAIAIDHDRGSGIESCLCKDAQRNRHGPVRVDGCFCRFSDHSAIVPVKAGSGSGRSGASDRADQLRFVPVFGGIFYPARFREEIR